MLKTFSFFILGFFMTCASDTGILDLGHGKSETSGLSTDPPRTQKSPSPPEFSLDKGSKIIKNGFMRFEVTNLEEVKVRIDNLVKSANAYYENEKYNAYRDRNSYLLTLRIPSQRFDSLVQVMEDGVGSLKEKRIDAKDVTEEYVDLNIRLDNNLAYLERYKAILAKAKTVEEVLEVQETIRGIEEEIESKKGRIRFLDDQVSYSTLDLNITELVESSVSNKPNFFIRLGNAFKSGVKGFLDFVIGMVYIWPFWLLVVLLFLIRKKIYRFFSGESTKSKSDKN